MYIKINKYNKTNKREIANSNVKIRHAHITEYHIRGVERTRAVGNSFEIRAIIVRACGWKITVALNDARLDAHRYEKNRQQKKKKEKKKPSTHVQRSWKRSAGGRRRGGRGGNRGKPLRENATAATADAPFCPPAGPGLRLRCAYRVIMCGRGNVDKTCW